MITAIHYIALLGSLLSASLLGPALFAYAQNEITEAIKLGLYAILGGYFFYSLLMGVRGRRHDLNRVNTICLVFISWTLFPILLAIPLADLFKISYGEAIFEAFSAFTTTGADGINNSQSLSDSAIWLRYQIQWLGGFATLATFTLFLGSIRIGGLPYRFTGKSEKSNDGKALTNRFLYLLGQFYLGFSLAAFTAFLICGLTPMQSILLTSSAVSTGGYITNLETLGSSVLLVFSFFLILGGTSVFWHRSVLTFDKNKLRAHRESYVLLFVVALLTISFFYAILKVSGNNSGFITVVSESIFNAASIATTSGIESRPGMFALLSPLLLLFLIFIGAGVYSTGGGVKIFRLGAMTFHTSRELSNLVYPNGVNKSGAGGEKYSIFEMNTIWTMFCACVAVVGGGAVALTLSGLSFEASITAAVAAFSNAGPFYSPQWVAQGVQGWPAYFEMNLNQKYILSSIMLFGRLEIIAIIAVINPFYWYRR